MDYIDIKEGAKIYPGEYLYYKPSKRIVICGFFSEARNLIKALDRGRLVQGPIDEFQKIKLTNEERRRQKAERGCNSCKGRR